MNLMMIAISSSNPNSPPNLMAGKIRSPSDKIRRGGGVGATLSK
ncbi:Uncharacterised protein [Mycobacterium tuberculosis]|nr:Uncharacterised protein [Mycobacterium tuberculosis]